MARLITCHSFRVSKDAHMIPVSINESFMALKQGDQEEEAQDKKGSSPFASNPACLCAFVCVHVYVSMRLCMCMCMCVRMCLHLCSVCVCVSVCVCACLPAWVCVFAGNPNTECAWAVLLCVHRRQRAEAPLNNKARRPRTVHIENSHIREGRPASNIHGCAPWHRQCQQTER